MRLNEKGIVEIVLIVIVLAILVVVGVVIFVTNGEGDDSADNNTITSETTGPEETEDETDSLSAAARDTERKSDIGRLISATLNYQANEGNGIAPTQEEFEYIIIGDYIEPADLLDPSTDEQYVFVSGDTVGIGEVRYARGFVCAENGVGLEEASSSNRAFAFQIGQESGETYCRAG